MARKSGVGRGAKGGKSIKGLAPRKGKAGPHMTKMPRSQMMPGPMRGAPRGGKRGS